MLEAVTFLILTKQNGKRIVINADQIIAFWSNHSGGSYIKVPDYVYSVTQDIEAILRCLPEKSV